MPSAITSRTTLPGSKATQGMQKGLEESPMRTATPGESQHAPQAQQASLTAAAEPMSTLHRRAETNAASSMMEIDDTMLPAATGAQLSSELSSYSAAQNSLFASILSQAHVSLSSSVASRRNALYRATPAAPTSTYSVSNGYSVQELQTIAVSRAPYCKMWTLQTNDSQQEHLPTIGELMPQWVLNEVEQQDGSKLLVPAFEALNITNPTLQQRLTNNGTYITDPSDPNCKKSMAQTAASANYSKSYTDEQYLPFAGASFAVSNQPSSGSRSAQYSAIGYRCAEETSPTTQFPFAIFPYSDVAYGPVEILPDFHAETLCATPVPTSTYYFNGISTLGFYAPDGMLAHDIFDGPKSTTRTHTLQETVTATLTVSLPFKSVGGQVSMAKLLADQRVENSAFTAINALLFGASALLLLVARRKANSLAQANLAP